MERRGLEEGQAAMEAHTQQPLPDVRLPTIVQSQATSQFVLHKLQSYYKYKLLNTKLSGLWGGWIRWTRMIRLQKELEDKLDFQAAQLLRGFRNTIKMAVFSRLMHSMKHWIMHTVLLRRGDGGEHSISNGYADKDQRAGMESEDSTDDEVEVAEVGLTLAMDMPTSPKQQEDLAGEIVEDIVKALGVRDRRRVKVKSMRAGSVICELQIKGGGAAELGEQLEAQIADPHSQLYRGKVTQHAVVGGKSAHERAVEEALRMKEAQHALALEEAVDQAAQEAGELAMEAARARHALEAEQAVQNAVQAQQEQHRAAMDGAMLGTQETIKEMEADHALEIKGMEAMIRAHENAQHGNQAAVDAALQARDEEHQQAMDARVAEMQREQEDEARLAEEERVQKERELAEAKMRVLRETHELSMKAKEKQWEQLLEKEVDLETDGLLRHLRHRMLGSAVLRMSFSWQQWRLCCVYERKAEQEARVARETSEQLAQAMASATAEYERLGDELADLEEQNEEMAKEIDLAEDRREMSCEAAVSLASAAQQEEIKELENKLVQLHHAKQQQAEMIEEHEQLLVGGQMQLGLSNMRALVHRYQSDGLWKAWCKWRAFCFEKVQQSTEAEWVSWKERVETAALREKDAREKKQRRQSITICTSFGGLALFKLLLRYYNAGLWRGWARWHALIVETSLLQSFNHSMSVSATNEILQGYAQAQEEQVRAEEMGANETEAHILNLEAQLEHQATTHLRDLQLMEAQAEVQMQFLSTKMEEQQLHQQFIQQQHQENVEQIRQELEGERQQRVLDRRQRAHASGGEDSGTSAGGGTDWYNDTFTQELTDIEEVGQRRQQLEQEMETVHSSIARKSKEVERLDKSLATQSPQLSALSPQRRYELAAQGSSPSMLTTPPSPSSPPPRTRVAPANLGQLAANLERHVEAHVGHQLQLQHSQMEQAQLMREQELLKHSEQLGTQCVEMILRRIITRGLRRGWRALRDSPQRVRSQKQAMKQVLLGFRRRVTSALWKAWGLWLRHHYHWQAAEGAGISSPAKSMSSPRYRRGSPNDHFTYHRPSSGAGGAIARASRAPANTLERAGPGAFDASFNSVDSFSGLIASPLDHHASVLRAEADQRQAAFLATKRQEVGVWVFKKLAANWVRLVREGWSRWMMETMIERRRYAKWQREQQRERQYGHRYQAQKHPYQEYQQRRQEDQQQDQQQALVSQKRAVVSAASSPIATLEVARRCLQSWRVHTNRPSRARQPFGEHQKQTPSSALIVALPSNGGISDRGDGDSGQANGQIRADRLTRLWRRFSDDEGSGGSGAGGGAGSGSRSPQASAAPAPAPAPPAVTPRSSSSSARKPSSARMVLRRAAAGR
jgi:hypothetical protein